MQGKDSNEKTMVNEILKVRGTVKDGIVSYKGIPYAKPPVGELRFAPPVPADDWNDILDCTDWGNIAIQDPGTEYGPCNEDCLNLNIWAPADSKPGDNLPVYFWIHGGGFCYGSGQESMYDGTLFAKNGIVVVTINYRLGVLGFLALEILMKKYGTTGNWGILDQICALKWVKDKIYAVGGDRNNVTIGGESAGSMSVFDLILSPLSAGLFKTAILQSGTFSYDLPYNNHLEDVYSKSREYAAEFGADDSEEGLEILRKVDAMEMYAKGRYNVNMLSPSKYAFIPAKDGVVLPIDELQALLDGDFNKDVKVIIGSNANEGKMFVNSNDLTQENMEARIRRVFRNKECAELIIDYIRMCGIDKERASWDVGFMLICIGVEKVQNEFARAGMTVYAYEFSYESELEDTTHGSELFFLSGQGVTMYKNKMQEQDLAVADSIQKYWMNFIKYGNPNCTGMPLWKKYVADSGTVMSIDKECSMKHRADMFSYQCLGPLYFAPKE